MHEGSIHKHNSSAALKTRHASVRLFFAYNETDRLLKIAPSGLKYSASVADFQGHWVKEAFHHTRGPVCKASFWKRGGCVSAWQPLKALLHYVFFAVARRQWRLLMRFFKCNLWESFVYQELWQWWEIWPYKTSVFDASRKDVLSVHILYSKRTASTTLKRGHKT